MNELDTKTIELFEEVLSHINTYGNRDLTEQLIRQAHEGRPDGVLVTKENLHLFRIYRNTVSSKPMQMVDEALVYARNHKETA